MIAELLLAGFVLASGAEPPRPEASLTVTYRGEAVQLGAGADARLRDDLEELLSGCSLSSPSSDGQARAELEVALNYRRPRTLATIARGLPGVRLDRILLTASASANGGWPIVHGAGPRLRQDFYKCDGGKILDTVCTTELQDLLPAKVRDNCSLAPRRRAGRT